MLPKDCLWWEKVKRLPLYLLDSQWSELMCSETHKACAEVLQVHEEVMLAIPVKFISDINKYKP